MFSRQIFVQAAAATVICAVSAIAQASPANTHEPMPDKADMASWHQARCSDHYARHVGEIAYLEAKLSLTDAQRPLFASWKDSVLSSAKSHESACMGMHPDFAHPPSILDREARMHNVLQQRLSEMDAQRPAMTALYQSLSADQKQVFDGIGRGGMHRGPGGGWHHHGDGDNQQG
jgi:hypothetical protein